MVERGQAAFGDKDSLAVSAKFIGVRIDNRATIARHILLMQIEAEETMRKIRILCAVVVLVGISTVLRAEVLKHESALGKLKPGQIVLINDGSCPIGQIKKVIGGDHVKVGGRAHVERKRICIAT